MNLVAQDEKKVVRVMTGQELRTVVSSLFLLRDTKFIDVDPRQMLKAASIY